MPTFTVTSIGKLGQTTSSTAGAVTLTGGASIGDLVIFAISAGSASGVNTVSDSKSNTWVTGTPNSTGTYGGRTQLFWSTLTTALVASDTITEGSGTSKQRTIDVLRCQVDTGWVSPVLDKEIAGNGSSTAPSSGASAATTNADDLLVGLCAISSITAAFTAGSGYTVSPGGLVLSGSKSSEGEYKSVAATGAQTADGTLSPTAAWQMNLTAFKANASGGAVVVREFPTPRAAVFRSVR